MDKYEEALERAKEWEREHPNGYVIRDMMEFIFPGYNDSEDERTRKELIHFILYKAGQLLDEETEHKFVAYLEKQKGQKPVARENDFVSNPKTSVEILRHYLVWAGNSDEEDCPYTWKTLADAIRDGIKALEEQKPAEWSEEDETCLEYALWCVTKTRCCVAKDACDLDACRCAERWLESLRSKPHWKPSEKQMKQ